MTSQLKPCPFCGHEADMRVEHKAGVLSVGCPDCNIRTMYVKADDIGASEAIEMWNARFTELVDCVVCAWFENRSESGAYCGYFDRELGDDYDGGCVWGIQSGAKVVSE